jgi:hypothetical protein
MKRMRKHRLSLTVGLGRGVIGLFAMLLMSNVAFAQRGLPRTRFSSSDLKKLAWIEGRWRGEAPGQAPFFEQYRFVNDSTLEITYFADSAFANSSGRGRVYLSVGRVYHVSGPGQWGASHIDDTGVYFIPERNASNSVSWTFKSPDLWIATLRSSATGQEQVTTYQMRRIK